MQLIIFGASGHGKVCAEIAEMTGKYNEIAFLDDDPTLTECAGYKALGPTKDFINYLDDKTEFFVAVGNNNTRKRLQEQIEAANGRVATLIHPNAIISKSATIGNGSVVMAGAVVNADATIEKGVIVNTSSSIDHDCKVGDFVHVAVGAHVCGTVNIGEKTWIGAGATIINNVNICDDCMIGAGATVVKDITQSGTYTGTPATKR